MPWSLNVFSCCLEVEVGYKVFCNKRDIKPLVYTLADGGLSASTLSLFGRWQEGGGFKY